MELGLAIGVLCYAYGINIPIEKKLLIDSESIREVLPFFSKYRNFNNSYNWTAEMSDHQFLDTNLSENTIISGISQMLFDSENDQVLEVISAAETVYGQFNLKKVNYLSTVKGRTPSEKVKNWILDRGGALDYCDALSHGPFLWHRYLLED